MAVALTVAIGYLEGSHAQAVETDPYMGAPVEMTTGQTEPLAGKT